jgi:hypothetical protein
MGAAVCAVMTLDGRLGDGLWCLGTMVIFAGVFVLAAVISVANGHDGAPYSWLGAIAGRRYVGSIVWLRLRG